MKPVLIALLLLSVRYLDWLSPFTKPASSAKPSGSTSGRVDTRLHALHKRTFGSRAASFANQSARPFLPASVEPTSLPIAAWPVWLAFAGWMIAVALASTASSIVVAAGAGIDGSVALLVSQLGLWTGFVGAAIIASRSFGTGDMSTGFGFGIARWDAAKSILIGVAVQLIVVPGIYLPLIAAGVDLDVSGPAEALFYQVSGPEKVAIAVGVVVFAPIAEELLFRGVLLRGLARRLGHGAAVSVSALLFAGTHFQLVQFPGLFAIGLTLGWLAHRTGGLAAPIWAHAAFNATTVAVLW